MTIKAAVAVAVVAGLLVALPATAATLITGSQVRNNSLTGKDVRNKSLTKRDFAAACVGHADSRGQLARRVQQAACPESPRSRAP